MTKSSDPDRKLASREPSSREPTSQEPTSREKSPGKTTFGPLRLQRVPLYSWIFRQLSHQPLPKLPEGDLYRTRPPSELYSTKPPVADHAPTSPPSQPATARPGEATTAAAPPSRTSLKVAVLAAAAAVFLGGLWIATRPRPAEVRGVQEPARVVTGGDDSTEGSKPPMHERTESSAQDPPDHEAPATSNAKKTPAPSPPQFPPKAPPPPASSARKPSPSPNLQERLTDPDALLIRPE